MDSATRPIPSSPFTPATILPALPTTSTTNVAAAQSGSMAFSDRMAPSSVAAPRPAVGKRLRISNANWKIFRTWVPPGYISRESLTRHHFLVCNDVLQHLQPLAPEGRENRVTPTIERLAQQQDVRRRGQVSAIVENHSKLEVIAAGPPTTFGVP